MAPTLSTQLLNAVSTQDGATFTVLLKAMATACATTELAVLQILSSWYFSVDCEASDFTPETYSTNPLVMILIQTERVSDFVKVYWSEVSDSVRFYFCYRYPAFMTKVVTEYYQTVKMLEASNFINWNPADLQNYLDSERTEQHICHQLLCMEVPGVTVRLVTPAVEAVIAAILADQPQTSDLSSISQQGFAKLVTLALASESNRWLKSLVTGQVEFKHCLSRGYYTYVMKKGLLSQAEVETLAAKPESFLEHWFESVFNHGWAWFKSTEAILTQVLHHSKDVKELPGMQLVQVEAVFKYSEGFQRLILFLALCAEIRLIGSTANLTEAQMTSLYNISCLVSYSAVKINGFNDLTANRAIIPHYKTLSLPQLILEVFDPDMMEWSRGFYDFLDNKMPNLKAKVMLFESVLLDRVDYDTYGHQGIKLGRADLPVVREALIKISDDPNGIIRYWYDILSPSRWSDQAALAQLYHTASNKGLFILYALDCGNKDITNEVFRAFKGNGKAKYELLSWFSRQVTDLSMISHAGRFVEYLSTLESSAGLRSEYHPNNWLAPELSSYYVE